MTNERVIGLCCGVALSAFVAAPTSLLTLCGYVAVFGVLFLTRPRA